MNFGGTDSASLLYKPSVSGSKPNDYELNTTWSIKSGGGTYVLYARTSSSGITGCSDSVSYRSFEFAMPTAVPSSGSFLAQITVYQCDSGTLTMLSSSWYTVADGMTLRMVVFDGTINGGSTPYGYSCLVSALNRPMCIAGSTGSTGNPGVGGNSIPSGSGFAGAKVGPRETVAPDPVRTTSIVSSVLPTELSFRWQPADDHGGSGTAFYQVYRTANLCSDDWGGCFQMDFSWKDPLNELNETEEALPGSTYLYSIQAVDAHFNYSTKQYVTLVSPPAGAIDPRRTGIKPLGSYWGGGGEQIDTMSGNMNYALPLLTAQMRGGGTVPFGLSYNSQNWRQDGGGNWKLAADVGYGFGWSAKIGSITPYREHCLDRYGAVRFRGFDGSGVPAVGFGGRDMGLDGGAADLVRRERECAAFQGRQLLGDGLRIWGDGGGRGDALSDRGGGLERQPSAGGVPSGRGAEHFEHQRADCVDRGCAGQGVADVLVHVVFIVAGPTPHGYCEHRRDGRELCLDLHLRGGGGAAVRG